MTLKSFALKREVDGDAATVWDVLRALRGSATHEGVLKGVEREVDEHGRAIQTVTVHPTMRFRQACVERDDEARTLKWVMVAWDQTQVPWSAYESIWTVESLGQGRAVVHVVVTTEITGTDEGLMLALLRDALVLGLGELAAAVKDPRGGLAAGGS